LKPTFKPATIVMAALLPLRGINSEEARLSAGEQQLMYSMYQKEHQMAEPVLRKGSTDPAVRDLQEALKALGHDPGPVDGVFGATTEAAVKAFQQAKGIAVDGIVGRVSVVFRQRQSLKSVR
jgi:peptidoglycan hydrolase-like protein with peptidoglycan-binding domain